jgi:predicted GIY-YIG superfamily endonuclease
MWYVYIIKEKQRFYTGITTALDNRLHQHGNPLLLYKEAFPNKHQAAKRERQIKGFSKAKKQELITRPVK